MTLCAAILQENRGRTAVIVRKNPLTGLVQQRYVMDILSLACGPIPCSGLGNHLRGVAARPDSHNPALPSNAPPTVTAAPTIRAMTSSNGQRLCDVGSRATSAAPRSITTAGTTEPSTAITRNKLLPE